MRLLLVEDNTSLATWLAKLLRGENYAVDVLGNAESVIADADLSQYDVALIDLRLPGMSGLELVRRVRQQERVLPILILTARSDLKSRVEVPTTTSSSPSRSRSFSPNSSPPAEKSGAGAQRNRLWASDSRSDQSIVSAFGGGPAAQLMSAAASLTRFFIPPESWCG